MLLNGKAGNMVNTDYLTSALAESCRYANQAGLVTVLKSTLTSTSCGNQRAMFLYDAFEEILETALSKQADSLLVQLTENADKAILLSCFLDGNRGILLAAMQELAQGSLSALNKIGARLEVKDLDDAISLTVSI